MKKLLPVIALAFLAVLVACEEEAEEVLIPSPEVTVSVGLDGTPAAGGTPSDGDVVAVEVCQPNPDPATAQFQVIDQPSRGDTVSSPVTISGKVLAFEATYQIAIFDADGNALVETFGTAEAEEVGELAPFSIDVPFQVTERTPACIWVYEQSAMSGEAIHVGQIPVLLSP